MSTEARPCDCGPDDRCSDCTPADELAAAIRIAVREIVKEAVAAEAEQQPGAPAPVDISCGSFLSLEEAPAAPGSCGWCRDPYCTGDHSGDRAGPWDVAADLDRARVPAPPAAAAPDRPSLGEILHRARIAGGEQRPRPWPPESWADRDPRLQALDEAMAAAVAAAERERIAAHLDALADVSGGPSLYAYRNAAREIRKRSDEEEPKP